MDQRGGPVDAVPGDYRGTIEVQAGVAGMARREIRLQVVAAAVPSERTLKVTNWFGFDDAQSRQFYRVAEFSPAGGRWWATLPLSWLRIVKT